MARHSKLASVAAGMAGFWAAGALAAANPYVGTWKKNAAESFGMADPAGQETTVIRRHDTVLDYSGTGTGPDGKTETFSYAGKVDCKEQALPRDAGLRGAMIATPSDVIEAKLWGPDGSLEDKFCILSAPRKLTCFATFTDGKGKVFLFKEVPDKQ